MQENHGLYVNRTEPIHLMTEVTSVLGSTINVNYKEIHLGYFDNFDEAVQARKQAEEIYYGQYSFDNSQKYAEQYKI